MTSPRKSRSTPVRSADDVGGFDQLADLIRSKGQPSREKIKVHHANGVEIGTGARGDPLEKLGSHVRRGARDRNAGPLDFPDTADQAEIRQLGLAF